MDEEYRCRAGNVDSGAALWLPARHILGITASAREPHGWIVVNGRRQRLLFLKLCRRDKGKLGQFPFINANDKAAGNYQHDDCSDEVEEFAGHFVRSKNSV